MKDNYSQCNSKMWRIQLVEHVMNVMNDIESTTVKTVSNFLEYNTNATNDIESASLTLNDNVSTTVRLWIV